MKCEGRAEPLSLPGSPAQPPEVKQTLWKSPFSQPKTGEKTHWRKLDGGDFLMCKFYLMHVSTRKLVIIMWWNVKGYFLGVFLYLFGTLSGWCSTPTLLLITHSPAFLLGSEAEASLITIWCMDFPWHQEPPKAARHGSSAVSSAEPGRAEAYDTAKNWVEKNWVEKTSGWFQPSWKILVNLDHFPK